jgi:hypothetical protein
MRRAILFVLCVLLLSGQRETLVHPVAHLNDHSPAHKQAALSSPQVAAECAECALLAGGFNAVAAPVVLLAGRAPATALVFHSYHSRAGEVPAWFESRAPPVLL